MQIYPKFVNGKQFLDFILLFMDKIFIKLKKAREVIGLTQRQAADMCGLRQRDISDLENGIKKFVPNKYLEFLYIQGLDMNTIFSDSFEVYFRNDKENLTPFNTNIEYLKASLADKEQKIISLSEQIGELKYRIMVLKKQNGYSSNAAEP